ncbi:unnamed protein product [Discosporangium mesarthrocarpum]
MSTSAEMLGIVKVCGVGKENRQEGYHLGGVGGGGGLWVLYVVWRSKRGGTDWYTRQTAVEREVEERAGWEGKELFDYLGRMWRFILSFLSTVEGRGECYRGIRRKEKGWDLLNVRYLDGLVSGLRDAHAPFSLKSWPGLGG